MSGGSEAQTFEILSRHTLSNALNRSSLTKVCHQAHFILQIKRKDKVGYSESLLWWLHSPTLAVIHTGFILARL